MKKPRYFYALNLKRKQVHRFKWKERRSVWVQCLLTEGIDCQSTSSRDPRVRAALREEGPWPRRYEE